MYPLILVHNQLMHPHGATAAQISQANRQYDKEISEYQTYSTVSNYLRNQILAAVDNIYFTELKDVDFGFADVTPQQLMTHLNDNYGMVTQDDIEANRAMLTPQDWNPDDPIKDLFMRITETCCLAEQAGEPINKNTAVRLKLKVLEDTGVFTNAREKRRDKAEANHTLVNFQTHFGKENRERLQKLTAKGAGYQGANAAMTEKKENAPPMNGSGGIKLNNGVTMY